MYELYVKQKIEERLANIEAGRTVITSYSIHYTKLYEDSTEPIPSARPKFRGLPLGKVDQAHRVAGPNRPNGTERQSSVVAGLGRECDIMMNSDNAIIPIAGSV